MDQPTKGASTAELRRPSPNLVFGVSFVAVAAVWMVWWVGLHPGLLSSDSLSMWKQAQTGLINNWHPYLYVLALEVLKHVYFSPSWWGLIQITMGAGLVAWIARIAAERGVRWWIIAPVVAFYALYPQYGVYSVTVWKDVPFSILLLAQAVLIYLASSSHRTRLWPYLAIGIIAGISASLRANGVINLVLPAVLLLMVRAPWRRLGSLLLAAAVTHLLVAFVLFNLIDVEPAILQTDQLRLKVVGAVYARDGELTAEERSFFESMWPESVWKSAYRPETANLLFFEHFYTLPQVTRLNPRNIDDSAFYARWQKLSTQVALRNPELIAVDKLEQARLMLPATDFIWVYVNEEEPSRALLARQGYPGIDSVLASNWFPGLRTQLEAFLTGTDTGWPRRLLWSGMPAMIGLGVMLAVALARWLKSTLLVYLFFAANVCFVILIAPSFDYRYLYFLALAAPSVLLMIVAEERYRRMAAPVPLTA